MAQWSRLGSGNTHLSKVQDRQKQLQHAIDVWRSIESGVDSEKQMQTVIRLAKRLLDARVRANKARIAAMDPRDDDQRLRAELKIENILNGGIDAILAEFDASDVRAD